MSLSQSRQQPGGEPYTLAWFELVYRAWLTFSSRTIGSHAFTIEEISQTGNEIAIALFALGVGSQPTDALVFLEAFNSLPWEEPPSSVQAIDDRTVAFTVLVYFLSQAALARGQRMRLQHPANPCFISYARADENFAHSLVAHLEAKGADVWWDLNAITLGAPLDESLQSAVASARLLFIIATPAADRSAYVRLEVETAIRSGLRVVPITLEDRMPPNLEALFLSARSQVEPVISAHSANDTAAFDQALAYLQRTPEEQLSWLKSQIEYQDLRAYMMALRKELREQQG